MFAKALTAFLIMPGMVAFVIPAVWLWHTAHTQLAHPFGLALLGIGAVALLWCVFDFYFAGKGTLAPWAPPKKLVVIGLYRYSRNPMYVAVILLLLGWAVSFESVDLLGYALFVAMAFHLRVVLGEEPWLACTHGDEWEQYVRCVPRWLW